MKIVFVSNYISHHQIPFCEALAAHDGVEFTFIQTEPMEAERVAIGWNTDTASLSYVLCSYEEPQEAARRFKECDILLIGGPGLDEEIYERLTAGKPVIRISERIYREGQWKFISPRGLKAKYYEHIRYKKMPCYLLCAGAYVASDFHLIGAYPGKMYRWGYFPPIRRYPDGEPDGKKERFLAEKGLGTDAVSILWAGRMIPLKHAEYALRLAKDLKERGVSFCLTMAGSGEKEAELKKYADENGLGDHVTFTGTLSPDGVRDRMEENMIFLFTSNYLEGWGAVVSEAMNSGCAVAAGSQAGAVPSLIAQGINGVIYDGESYEDLLSKVLWLIRHPEERKKIGNKAMETILTKWNAQAAADRLYEFGCRLTEQLAQNVQDGKLSLPSWEDGPMSAAPVIKPFVHPAQLPFEKEDTHG